MEVFRVWLLSLSMFSRSWIFFFFFTCGVFLFSEFSVVTGFDFLFDSEGV